MVPTTRKCTVCMPQRSPYQLGLFRIRDGYLLFVVGVSPAQLLTVVVVVVSTISSNGISSQCSVSSILLAPLVNGEEASIGGRNGKEVEKLDTLTSTAVGVEGGGGGWSRGGIKSGSLIETCSFGTSWVTFIAPWRLMRKRTYT